MKSWVPKRVPVCSPSPAPDYKHDLCEYGIMLSVVNYNVFDQVQGCAGGAIAQLWEKKADL